MCQHEFGLQAPPCITRCPAGPSSPHTARRRSVPTTAEQLRVPLGGAPGQLVVADRPRLRRADAQRVRRRRHRELVLHGQVHQVAHVRSGRPPGRLRPVRLHTGLSSQDTGRGWSVVSGSHTPHGDGVRHTWAQNDLAVNTP